jgi:hypothetical protein
MHEMWKKVENRTIVRKRLDGCPGLDLVSSQLLRVAHALSEVEGAGFARVGMLRLHSNYRARPFGFAQGSASRCSASATGRPGGLPRPR